MVVRKWPIRVVGATAGDRGGRPCRVSSAVSAGLRARRVVSGYPLADDPAGRGGSDVYRPAVNGDLRINRALCKGCHEEGQGDGSCSAHFESGARSRIARYLDIGDEVPVSHLNQPELVVEGHGLLANDGPAGAIDVADG